MTYSQKPIWIGILGSGQLGRMLALAGYPLGFRFRLLDTTADSASGHLADLVVGSLDDMALVEGFADDLAVVTYEFENVPIATALALVQHATVYPPPIALEVSQDRLVEKSYFSHLGIPTAQFARVDTQTDLESSLDKLGYPAVLKTRRMGYDGKGQVVLYTREQAGSISQSLGKSQLILEAYVPFESEVSLLAVRGIAGEQRFYPLVTNTHRAGILRQSIPTDLSANNDNVAALQQEAEEYATRILSDLNYVGVLAIEFFVVKGRLIANEMAPRVHNSGHWTIEGAETSQFENHIRAITGLPLGSTALTGHSAMLNIIGRLPDRATVLSVPFAHLHLYDKAPRPGRKIGHITINAPSIMERATAIQKVMSLL